MNKFIPFLLFIASFNSYALVNKDLPIGFTPHEKLIYQDYLNHQDRVTTDAPIGPVHSLGEWEDADAVLTLWNNKTLLKALSENGNVKILAEDNSDKEDWVRTIEDYNLDSSRFSFYVVPTDSIWVRDYGPWWIVDGNGKFGIVDNIYNRPRPQDDVVPDFIGHEMNVPVYKTGLVHTGGNYYSDGLGNAFSSTLPFKENSKFSLNVIINKMLEFLGIEQYTTSPLGEEITIEHLDTFGKLVAPDTWVFSEFDKNSTFYNDAEKMVNILKTMTSPYGTPYKIHRLKMVSYREGFRAYLNSFISNGALYFPAYGDNEDETVKSIYQAALPGYKIIGVDAQGTEWGDSVHCRTRNLIKKDATFIFPHVKMPKDENDELVVTAEIVPPPGAQIASAEVIFRENGIDNLRLPMTKELDNNFKLTKTGFSKGATVDFYILAKDSLGKQKSHPMNAPQMTINFKIP